MAGRRLTAGLLLECYYGRCRYVVSAGFFYSRQELYPCSDRVQTIRYFNRSVESIGLVDRLQFLPWFESNRFTGWDGNLGASARIAPDPGLAGTNIEYAKATQFDAIAARQCVLHALKNGFNRQFSFRFSNACSGNDFIDDVELNHKRLPDAA